MERLDPQGTVWRARMTCTGRQGYGGDGNPSRVRRIAVQAILSGRDPDTEEHG